MTEMCLQLGKKNSKGKIYMENRLKKLFDFQRFQGNKHMETLISDTESRYEKEPEGLLDEELDFVNAAGEMSFVNEKNSKETGEDKK